MRRQFAARTGFIMALSLALLGANLTHGCATYHVYQVGGPGGLEQGNQPMTEWESRNLNSFFWGLIRQDLPVENCALGDGTRTGIEEVKIEYQIQHTLASIVTLGIWRPMKVSWRCAKPQAAGGVLE